MAIELGVSIYSFSRLLARKEITIEQALDYAREIGCDGVEFTGLVPPGGTDALRYAARLRQACADRGLKIPAYLVGADLLGENPEKEIARLRNEVDIAAALGAPLFRHDAAFAAPIPAVNARAETFDAVLPRLADGARAITEYAATLNIRTMVENHGLFCQDSARVEKLCTAVNHPNFGLLFDMGNFLCADENPQTAARVLPLAFHVHAKDFLLKSGEISAPDGSWFATRGGNWLRGTVLGHGVVPVAAIVRRLAGMNYNGAISVEFEGAEEVLPALRSAIEYLRRLLP